MNRSYRIDRRRGRQALLLWLLACALLVPRIAPAFAVAMDGTRAVTLCTSGGLVRVYVDADGHRADPIAALHEATAGVSHCDLVPGIHPVLQRHWQATGEQRAALRRLLLPAPPMRAKRGPGEARMSARGPPAAA